MNVRDAQKSETERLGTIWHDGWHDAHAAIMPAELTRMRTRASFVERLYTLLPHTRVAELDGDVVGFAIVKGDELYQLYVEPQGRGRGVAAALIADAERRIAAAGADIAWLACAIGNDRAARFYEKSGWRRAGVVPYEAETENGIFPLEVWRYEKVVHAAA